MKIIVSFFLVVLLAGNSHAQTCQDAIVATAPDSRYLDNADGTVTDLHTGLIWKQCSEGQSGGNCLGFPASYNWQQAMQQVETLNASGGFAGSTDWRLPNVKELASLIEEKCITPSINESFFPTPASLYWTSSPYSETDSFSWYISFSTGFESVTDRNTTANVRLVRGP